MVTDNSDNRFKTTRGNRGAEANAAQAVADAVQAREKSNTPDQKKQQELKQAEERVAAEDIARQQQKKAEAEQSAAQQKPAGDKSEPTEDADVAGPGLSGASSQESDSKFTQTPAPTAEELEDDLDSSLSGEHKSLFTFLAGHSGGAMKPANVQDALGAEFMAKLQEERGVSFNDNGVVELSYKTGEKLLLSAQQNPQTGAAEMVVTLPKGTAMTEEIARDMVRIQKARGADVVSIGKKHASFDQRAMLLQAAKNESMNISKQSFSAKEWQKLSVNNPETPEIKTLLEDLNETYQSNAQTVNDAEQPDALRKEAQQNLVRTQALHGMLIDAKASPAGWKADNKTIFAVQKVLAQGKKADGGLKQATLDKALKTAGMSPADLKKLDQAATPATQPKTAPKANGGIIPDSTFEHTGTASKTQGAPLQSAQTQEQSAAPRAKAPKSPAR